MYSVGDASCMTKIKNIEQTNLLYIVSVWIQLNSAFSIYVCVLLKLRSTSAKRKRKLKTHMGGNARLLRNASFQPHYLTKSIVNSTFVHCSQTHKFYFSVIFFIKMGSTVLFIHLKIIQLQCFQFQISVSAKISSFLLKLKTLQQNNF